jgi:hypothetical protein
MAITNTALAQAISDFIASQQDRQDEFADWLGGVVGGGPGSDGRYPLTDHEGNTVTVASPAQMEADLDELIDAGSGSAAAAAASASAAATSASTASTQAGLAATARTNAETAETNAETAQAAAESARNTAIAQATAAATSATNALASENAAELAETNAEAAEVAAEAAQAAAEAAAAAAATFDPALFAALADNETITGAWQFTSSGAGTSNAAIRIVAAVPYLGITESDQAADSQRWLYGASAGVLHISPVADAATGPQVSQGLHFTRSGLTCTEMQYDATAHDMNGTLDLSGAAVLNSTLQVLGVTEFASTLPIVRWKDTDAGTNEKNWLWYASGTQMILATATDASPGAAAASVLTFTRSGTTPSGATLTGALTMGSNSLVEGGSGNSANLYLQHNNNASSGVLIQTDSGNNLYLWNYENATIQFATNNAARVDISNTGFRVRAFGSGAISSDANGNLFVSSDERLKTDIVSFGRGLEAIRGLEPVTHRWNEESGLDAEGWYTGFIAQNVQENIPEAVGCDSRGYLTLVDRAILATIVNSIKELDARVSALRGQHKD